MTSRQAVRHTRTRARLPAALAVLAIVAGCGLSSTTSPTPQTSSASGSAAPSAAATAAAPGAGSLVLVGRIVTMDEPPVAEAILIEDGTVAAVGTRDEVLALAADDVPVIDIGQNVAYPGFIDAHAHWIGDREYYGLETAAEAMDAAISRGWTSISEQWVNPERLDELTGLAAQDALSLRVDAYLALNYEHERLGDWYVSREPGPVDDRLRVQGLKIHLDDGGGNVVLWEPEDLTATIGRASEAGWQVSVHSMSSAAQELVLDAFEAALGPTGPNPLHHRMEHAVQVTDAQLARLVAMDIGTVIHPDGVGDWLLFSDFMVEFDRDNPGAEMGWPARWRDFVDAGLHVAAASDAPWTFPGSELTEDVGRPLDQIAAGMDGRRRTSEEIPAWALDQLLTAEEGLRAVTIDAAWTLGDESRRGHLAPGTLGDVTIMSGDVTAATPDEIRAMTVVATIVGGIPAYCADPAICSQLGG
jgi:predicted amidohydrolase YtcJ